MKIDFISDIHVDTWVRPHGYAMDYFVGKIVPIREDRSDILVIAGDLGHDNNQNAKLVKCLSSYYEHIIVVPGNHDLYLIDPQSIDKYQCDSFYRLLDLEKQLNDINGVHFLNGTTVKIDGVVFGGTIGWYDGVFAEREHNFTEDRVNSIWKYYADSRFVFTPDRAPFNWRSYFKVQYDIMEKLVDSSDVMITHYVPMWDKMRAHYRRDPSSGFFHFDGYNLVEKMSGKIWIYGHTHDQFLYEHAGCTLACNPLGYEGEFFDGYLEEYDKLPRMIRQLEK